MTPATFLIELGAVILSLAVLARLATRVGFSPIPLYLAAGLAFGQGGLLPLVTAEEFIRTGAELGVILLLFMLGLEYSIDELTRSLRTSAPAGIADLVLNFTPGLLAGVLLGWGVVGGVVLGGITYMSSSGVIAKLLDDLGWTANLETPVILAILVIEDLLMAVYLPVLAALTRGGDLGGGLASLMIAAGAVSVILVLSKRFGSTFSRLVFNRSDEVLLLSIFGITLAVAGIAERIHVSAAVGAFLVGIALSGPAADRARMLLAPLRDLFAAAFFVFFGLRVDPAAIPPVLATAAALAVVTSLTKVSSGWWSARRIGVGRRGRWRAGAALIARGEFSIAIAALGVAGGVDGRLGPVAAAYVLILAVAGPIVARVIDPVMARRTRPSRPVAATAKPAGTEG